MSNLSQSATLFLFWRDINFSPASLRITAELSAGRIENAPHAGRIEKRKTETPPALSSFFNQADVVRAGQ
jgi:hypothetical protein